MDDEVDTVDGIVDVDVDVDVAVVCDAEKDENDIDTVCVTPPFSVSTRPLVDMDCRTMFDKTDNVVRL